ncbi:glycosyltransferase family 4 protein [Micromonospora sp. NPDC049366]|uniref:glycosyltransferase family 4 protein n=1 Tax=Micromonospora sp. NPDC049366 TaxID=3364271 RepID=UPI0037B963EB
MGGHALSFWSNRHRPARRRALGRPDLIVDVCNGLPFLSPLYARCAVLILVHHVHREQWPVVRGSWGARMGWWIESRLAGRVYRRCRYVTVSAATRRELSGLGVDPSRVEVIYNGTPEITPGAALRTPHPSLLVLCRLVPHKRVEIALETVARLAVDFPALRLIVAGQGWWETHLRATVTQLGIHDRVQFAGFVSDAEKQRLLCSTWVALTPSLKEGWGLTIVEAGAAGTPTVAFRGAGGVAEAIVAGETGLLADDTADFIAQVRRLLSDDQFRHEMGKAAQEHAAHFTWATSGKRFAALVAAVTDDLAPAPSRDQRAP